jgi:hypothetical protein
MGSYEKEVQLDMGERVCCMNGYAFGVGAGVTGGVVGIGGPGEPRPS